MTILISPRWSDWYWIVNDTNKTTKVYSTASNAYVNNNAAAFLTWLADANFGAASNLGSSVTISAAADNGSGKTRLTVESSANFATGQFFYFGANGAQQITVIDGTHVDLIGLAFGSYVATAVMQGASIIDTDANLRKHLNTVALRTNAAGANTITSGADVTLTNPTPLYINVNMTISGKKLILPPMNTPQSLPIGTPLIIENFGNGGFDIYLNDATTFLAFCQGGNGSSGTGEKVLCELIDNSTANGTIKTISIQRNTSLFGVKGLFAKNTAGSPNTKMDATLNAFVGVRDGNLTEPRSFSFFPGTLLVNIDTGAAGPVAGGRDQAGAFGASLFLHFFAIFSPDQGANGLVSTSFLPTLPSGYTHFAYLFTSYFDASSHLVPVHVVGNRVSYDGRQVALNGGAATVDTAVNVSTLVPPLALDFDLNIESLGVTADGTGAAISVLHLGYLSGTDTHQLVTDFAVAPTTATRLPAGDITFPNVSQQFYYRHQVLNGSAPSATAVLRSYTVPNGS